jgi:putative aldouronate transport system permease protein
MYLKNGQVSTGRFIFNIFNYIFITAVAAATLYPFLYVAAASVSKEIFILQGKVGIIPMGFRLDAYKAVLGNPYVPMAYKNTLIYTVLGTTINIIFTTFGAYSLSRRRLPGRNFFMFLIAFTMLFSGGLIPSYLVVRNLKLVNTIWALSIPHAVNAFNLIILRTFFQSIPVELEDAALIDGCNEFQTLFRIIIPVSVPGIMTIALFYAVGHWNDFFKAMIYFSQRERYPLQLILRDIVIAGEQVEEAGSDIEISIRESVKYSTIMVATIPIVCVYPFIQKYFVKGIMIGSLKG